MTWEIGSHWLWCSRFRSGWRNLWFHSWCGRTTKTLLTSEFPTGMMGAVPGPFQFHPHLTPWLSVRETGHFVSPVFGGSFRFGFRPHLSSFLHCGLSSDLTSEVEGSWRTALSVLSNGDPLLTRCSFLRFYSRVIRQDSPVIRLSPEPCTFFSSVSRGRPWFRTQTLSLLPGLLRGRCHTSPQQVCSPLCRTLRVVDGFSKAVHSRRLRQECSSCKMLSACMGLRKTLYKTGVHSSPPWSGNHSVPLPEWESVSPLVTTRSLMARQGELIGVWRGRFGAPHAVSFGYQPLLFDYQEDKVAVSLKQANLCRCRSIWRWVHAALTRSSLQFHRQANYHNLLYSVAFF